MSRVLFLFFCLSCFGQYKVSHYTTENGLPHDLCYQIIQDKDGYVWIGTDNGLAKFNGQDFEVFNRNQGLNSNFVIDINEKDDKKYIATWGGGCYLFKNNVFKVLREGKYKFSKQQQIISDEKGFIYTVENKKRLNIINTKNKNSLELYRLYKTDKSVKWIKSFDDTNIGKKDVEIPLDIQIANLNNEVYSFTDRYSPNFKGIIPVKESTRNSYLFLKDFFIIDLIKKGNYYIAVTPNSTIEFNSKKILKINYLAYKNKTIIHYSENIKYKVYILFNNKTSSNELLIINKQKNSIKIYNNILKSSVSDVFISNDNTVWVSTYGNGLFVFQENILPLKKRTLNNYFIFDYIEQRNQLFFLTNDNIIGTDKNFNFLEKREFKTCAFFKENYQNTVFLVNKDQINRSEFFLNTLFKSNFKSFNFFWNNIKIEYGDNRILYYKNNRWSRVNFKLADQDYTFLKIRQLIPYNGKLYVVSNFGLFVLNENFQIEKFYNKTNGLIGSEVKKAFILKNKLYVLQYQNVSVFDGVRLANYPYVNNQNNFFNDFTYDQNGAIWLASQRGLLLFKNGNYQLFTKNEGLSSSFYSKIYSNSKNELIALGNNGVDVFKTNDVSNYHNIKIFLLTNDKIILPSKTVSFESKSRSIVKIEFINYINSKFQIEYQINNQEWIALKGNYIDFSNYSNGNYKLKIRWKFYFTNWKNLPEYNIEIKAPWYQRWYFYVIIIIAISLGFSYLIKRRIETLKLRNERLQNLLERNSKLQFQLDDMRNNIAQDFHDELGNKLAGISVLSDKLLNDENLKKDKNFPIIERIYGDSQDLFNGIRDFIWAIDSKNGNLEELIFALTDFGENLFEYSPIKFVVENKIENASFLLPNFWNRQLLLLFKEAMTNTYRHSYATQISLKFIIENECLIIKCEDNGVGFDIDALTRQNGLQNLKRRASKLNAELDIISLLGTRVVFRGKLN